MVESDFGRSLALAETAEATKAEEYEAMTKQNKLTKALSSIAIVCARNGWVEVQKDADQKFKSNLGWLQWDQCVPRKTAQSLDKAAWHLRRFLDWQGARAGLGGGPDLRH